MAMTATGLKALMKEKLLALSCVNKETFNAGHAEDTLEALAEAIVEYITANAVVSFTPGEITGTCPPGTAGGPLTLGTGAGGRIN